MTGGDSGPKLVMKGSPVRVRASALKVLQISHLCSLSRRHVKCSKLGWAFVRADSARFRLVRPVVGGGLPDVYGTSGWGRTSFGPEGRVRGD
jgi:hypothetical protein